MPKNASDDDIKKAYRKLARENHPDANPGDNGAEERFKEVQGAYDVLSDAEKRKAYDAYGEAGARGFPGGAGPDLGGMRFEEFDLGNLGGNLGDILGGMFGGRRPRAASRQPMRGNDLETHVRISFEDSLEGVQVRVPVEVETACSVCRGTGAEPGTAPIVCPTCGGRGVVSEAQGLFAFSQPCPRCRGNGTIVESPCRHCRGSGRELATKRYAVKIPAGAKSGTKVRLKGKGEAGHDGGPAGDLFVVVDVDPSPLFERRGVRPRARRPRHLRRGGARCGRRDPDAVRAGVAEGAERHRERETAAREGARSAAPEGLGPWRPPRAREGHRSEEADEGGARRARGLPEGVARGAARELREGGPMTDTPVRSSRTHRGT